MYQDDETPALPAELVSVTQPVTAHLGGVDLRLAGRDRRPGPFRGGAEPGARERHPANDRHRRAAHRAGAAPRGVLRRHRHRPACRWSDRGRQATSGRIHRRCLARAADAPVGHRGQHLPRADAGSRRRLVSHGVHARRRGVETDASAARGHALAGSLRRDPADAGQRAGGCGDARRADRRPLRGHRGDAASHVAGRCATGRRVRERARRSARPAAGRPPRQRLQVRTGRLARSM